MELVFGRLGVGLDATRIVMFVHEWAMVEAKLGHRIGIEEYASAGPDGRMTAYRRLKLFRTAFADEFGDECTPASLIVWPEGLPLPAKTEPNWRLAPA
jgi:hypothetical protein